MKSLSDKLAGAFKAVQTATVRNDNDCLEIISEHISKLLEEVAALESKTKEKDAPPA